jgi:hypothetical protein
MSSACTDGCFFNSTAQAQGLFDFFNDCITERCPYTDPGACGPSSSSSACSNCQRAAATGACVSRLTLCTADNSMGPPNGDGGAIYPDAGTPDAGMRTNCGELLACEAQCGVDGGTCLNACLSTSTPEAQSLANAVARCWNMICPSADGGVCATPSMACSGCITQSEFDNGECGIPFTTCQTDTSNSPDASVTPVALQGGTVRELVTGLDQPQVVIINNGYAYYSNISFTGAVSRVSLSDGGISNLSSSEPFPMGLAMDDNNIYVWNSGSFSGQSTINNRDGTIVQIPLDGGAHLTLRTGMEVMYAAPYLNAIAVDSKRVYWVEGGLGNDGTIMSTPIGVATPTVVYSNLQLPEAVVSDGVNLYWTSWGTFDQSGNYNNDGTVMEGSVDGGTPVVLAMGQSAPAAIAIDSKSIYWTNAGRLGGGTLPAPNTGSVNQVAMDGGAVIPLATQEAVPLSIAVKGTTVYYTQYVLVAPGEIRSVPVGGGAVVRLVAGTANPFGLTVSGNQLYWTSSPPTAHGSGSVWVLDPLP